MSPLSLLLVLFLLGTAAAPAAVLSVVTRSSYKHLTDSPWYSAVVAGDALKKVPSDCTPPGFPIPFTCYEDAATMPDGLGVHDNFEDTDLISPFVQVDEDEMVRGQLNEFFGIFYSSQLTSGRNQLTQQPELPMTFIATEDGKFPMWLGFAIFNPDPTEVLQIIGVDGSIENINLYNITSALPPPHAETYPFVGFIFDRPVIRATIYGSGSSIDHLQYGYGAQPIPEPSSVILVAGTRLLLGRRRR